MQLVNRHGLHAGIEDAIRQWFHEKQSPNPSYFRVTELVRPVQQVVLQRRYHDQIEVDVMDLINAWRGTAVHEYLSRYDKLNTLKEIELSVNIGGETVIGHPDYYEDGALVDLKNCKVWSYIYKSNIPEWTDQLNMYKYLLEEHGFPVKSLSIVAIFDDWKPSEARRGGDYPQTRSVVIPIEILPRNAVVRYMEKRVKELSCHIAIDSEPQFLPPCTPDEMWEEPTVYAVMKEGRKSAVKLHTTEQAMNNHIHELGAKHYPQVRPGRRIRCEDYCSVSRFCNQFKAYKETMKEEGDDEGTV